MKKMLKKQIAAGVICGMMLFTAISAGAMSSQVEGFLKTSNPPLAAPKGYAKTTGYKTITAKCTVSKSGYTTNSVSASKKEPYGGSVETNSISGPTWASAGTTFKSTHTGYSSSGAYQTKTASKKY